MSSCEPEDPVHRNLQTWIRIIQTLCNIILSLVGKGGVSLGVLTKIGYFNELQLFDHYETLNVDVFFGSSVVLTIISWIGISAGTRNCRKSSITNGLLLGGFVISTTAYVATKGIITDYTRSGHLYDRMKTEMKDYDNHPHFIDTLQTTLLCCGLNGVKTWNKSHIPESCCRNKLACSLDSPYLHTNGCFEEFIRTGRYYAWLLYSILASSGVLEIFGIILSRLQCRIINDRNKKKLANENPPKIPRPFVMEFKRKHEEKEKKKKEVQEKKEKEEVQKEDKKQTVQEKKETELNACRICKDFISNNLTLHFY